MLRFLVFAQGQQIGHTDLAHLDAGMGVAHGLFLPLPAYDLIRDRVVRASEARHAGREAEALPFPLELRSRAGEILATGFVAIDDFGSDDVQADLEVTAQLKDRVQVERLGLGAD